MILIMSLKWWVESLSVLRGRINVDLIYLAKTEIMYHIRDVHEHCYNKHT